MSDGLLQELEVIGATYSAAFNRHDADAIAALYVDDGVHINPAGPRIDIAEFYRGLFRAGLAFQESTVDRVWPAGTDTAVAVGQFRTTGKDASGAAIEIRGYSTATYVRTGGHGRSRCCRRSQRLR